MLKLLLQRPILLYNILAIFLLLGIFSYNTLPVSLMPQTENPSLTIIVRYPNIPPKKIEEIITKPIEEQISGLGGIDSIYSSSEEGESRINLTFNNDKSISKLSLEVRSKIDLIRQFFPREVDEPVITRFDPTDRPIYIISLESTILSLKDLRSIADNKIKKSLERIDGVSEIKIGGGLEREIVVNIDKGKMDSLYVDINEIMSALSNNNKNIPIGEIKSNEKITKINSIQKFQSIESIAQTIIKSNEDGKFIRLNKIASVEDGFRDQENISRQNGKEIVSIYIHKAGNANTLDVCKEVNIFLEKFAFDNLSVNRSFDQSESIQNALLQVQIAAITGGIFAIIILFLFLRSFNALFLIASAIPISVIITFLIMKISKTGLDILSLSGLALAVGMMVDSAIVIIDKIYSNYDQKSYYESIHFDSANSVSKELLASTLTSVAVFLPFFLSSDITGKLYKGLSVTISGALFSSLIVSIFFLPLIAKTVLLKKGSDFKNSKTETYLSSKLDQFLFKLLNLLPKYLRFYTLNDLSNYYIKLVLFYINNKKFLFYQLLAFLLLGLSSLFFIKQEYIDPIESGEIKASIELETGTHLEATNEIIKSLETSFKQLPELDKITVKVEKWHADMYLTIKKNTSETTNNIIDKLKKIAIENKKAYVFFSEGGDIGQNKEIDIDFIGNNTEELKELCRESSKLISSIPGIQQVALRFRDGKDEITLELDNTKLKLSQLSSSLVTDSMKTLYTGSIPTKYFDGEREIDIKVKVRKKDRENFENYAETLFSIDDKSQIKLSSLVNITKGKSETRIYRKNKRNTATITVKIGELDTGSAVGLITKKLQNLKMDENTYWEFSGNYEKLRKNRSEMILLFILAFLLIYFILASLFESLIYPLIIIFTVPLGVLGSILFLFIFGQSLNISVYIGFIMLIGITVNNSIILVDTYLNQNNRSLEILLESCKSRLRPILITTLTTIFGMIPTAISTGSGSQLWKPLAITVIFGLSISSYFTLFVVPILLQFLDQKNNNSYK
jgi:HAE1 family hydrophobic/amphiphilic exporter-1